MDVPNVRPSKRERNFPSLDLTDQPTPTTAAQPVLVIQSPKTPTLSRKLKAVSLDSETPKQSISLELARDVSSMPNTPKKQLRSKLSCESIDTGPKTSLVPTYSTNLKKFSSNTSISGSQTLKTLPEVMTLHDFSDTPTEPVKFRAKGLLERRGSNASLTIDLGSNSNLAESKVTPTQKLHSAKSVSNLNLSTFGKDLEKCACSNETNVQTKHKCIDRRKSQETCGTCTIYEIENRNHRNTPNFSTTKCRCNSTKCRRKSLSNENLYVPPCSFCQTSSSKLCMGVSKYCKGSRQACYPRQTDMEPAQLLSDDFKLHLQNLQYLQTAGNVLTVAGIKAACEVSCLSKLHQEFWEVPLNLQEKCYVSGSQSKNRYRGVLPNEHSRVHLCGQNYIHANYIKGPDYTEAAYIATQGPMTHTCKDFWEMVWNVNCSIIVMLTGLVEKGKNKCELYFPLGKKGDENEKSSFFVKSLRTRDKFTFDNESYQDEDEELIEYEELNEVQYENYTVKYLKDEKLNECTLRFLEVTKKMRKHSETRMIYHYWFDNWQDHKMANPKQVLDIALHVLNVIQKNDISKVSDTTDIRHSNPNRTKSTTKNNNFDYDLKLTKSNSLKDACSRNMYASYATQRKKSSELLRIPLTVHCSAGIGRTGCFLAILNGIQQLRNNLNVDVLAILCSLRLNRGGMVQTAEQYELIHRVLSLYTEML